MNKEDSFTRIDIDDKIRIFTNVNSDNKNGKYITAFFVYEPAPDINSAQSGTLIWEGYEDQFPWEEKEEKSKDNFQKKLAQRASKIRRELEAQTNLKEL